METTTFYQDAAYEVIELNNWIEDGETQDKWEREMEGDIKSFMKKAMLCIITGNFEISDERNNAISSLYIITLFDSIDVYMYDNKISVGLFEYPIPLNYMRKYKHILYALEQSRKKQQSRKEQQSQKEQ